jgi:hypothetical protein
MVPSSQSQSDEPKTKSKDAIIAAIATVLAAVITAAGVIIANTNRAKDTLEQQVVVLQDELAKKTSDAKRTMLAMEALQKRVNDLQARLDATHNNNGDTGSNPPRTTVETSAGPVLNDEIDNFLITITRVKLSGNTLTFDFNVVNNAPADRYLMLFGAGSFGNGNSRFMADGEEYAATGVRVGNETRNGIVGKRLVSGVPLKGFVAFKGVPRTLASVAILEFAYSYDNLKPSGAFRFTNLQVSQ